MKDQVKFSHGRHGIRAISAGFDQIQDPVIITDPDAKIIYANTAMSQAVGFSRKQMMNKTPGHIWGSNMPKAFYQDLWHTIKVERRPFIGEVLNTKRDRSQEWQELHISPVLDTRGNIKFFVGIEPIITNRKSKERFNNEFTSLMSHQLKNPLAAMILIIDLLRQKDKRHSKEEAEMLKDLYDETRHLNNIINDLKYLSQVGKISAKQEPYDLIELIEEVVSQTHKTYPTIPLEFEKKSATIKISANKTMVSQIFYNLIDNAAKYSAEGQPVQLKLTRHKTKYVFSCKNHGIGIPAAEQHFIFSRFFRASNTSKTKREGTGLGLYLVKALTYMLGWSVNFKSIPNKTTVFSISIPVSSLR